MKEKSLTKMKLALLALVVVMMAMPAMSQDSSCSPVDCVGMINSLYVTSAGGTTSQALVYINLSSGGPSSCSLVAGLYYSLPPGTKGYDQMYSLLLDAAVAKIKVDIRVNGGGGVCTVNYVVLY